MLVGHKAGWAFTATRYLLKRCVLVFTIFVCCLGPDVVEAVRIFPFYLTAPSALLIDRDTSKILFSKAPRAKRAPASTVKVLTALVVMDRLPLNRVVSASKRVVDVQPSKIYMRRGERFYVRDLLRALLIESANDAALTLAEAAAGSEAGFVELMNAKARRLRLRDSHFLNPHGLPREEQYSTAYDLAKVVLAASRNDFLMKVMRTRETTIRSLEGRKIALKNHNKMMWRDSRTVVGKTGWTRRSRHCFAGRIIHRRKDLVVVVMGSRKPWSDLKKILDHCFGRTMGDRIARNRKLLTASYVKSMQAILKRQGFDPGSIDGAVGPKTVRAVMKFQKVHGLTPDGIVGPLTQAKLREFSST